MNRIKEKSVLNFIIRMTFLSITLISNPACASILNRGKITLKTDSRLSDRIKREKRKQDLLKPKSESHKYFNSLESQFSNNYEFIIFYSSRCAYCKTFASVLKKYSYDRNFDVRGFIIGDNYSNQKIDLFPNSTIAEREVVKKFFEWNNAVVPSLFLMNKKNLHVYPVSQGALTYMELSIRMNKLVPKILKNEGRSREKPMKMIGKDYGV